MHQLHHDMELAEKLAAIVSSGDSGKSEGVVAGEGAGTGGGAKGKRGKKAAKGRKDIVRKRRQSVQLASMRRRSVVGAKHHRQDLTEGEMQKLLLLKESDGTIQRCINFRIEELDRLAEGHFWQQLAGESQGMESYKEADLRKL